MAAAADFICENLTLTPALSHPPSLKLRRTRREREDVAAACLLHDMGNIIKFKLEMTNKLFPGMFTEKDLKFWQQVKQDFINRYGLDEHEAAIKIGRELAVNDAVIEYIDCIGFNTATINAESKNMGRKICAYSDMRVWPQGITSLEHRLRDLRARYESKFHLMGGDEEKRLEFESGLRTIQEQIFAHCKIKPTDITEESIAPIKEKLKSFEI